MEEVGDTVKQFFEKPGKGRKQEIDELVDVVEDFTKDMEDRAKDTLQKRRMCIYDG